MAKQSSRPLRAVSDDEKPPRPKNPKSVTQAAEDGTQRELLFAMKTRVAAAVENPNTAARDLSSLTKRLMEITNELDAIDARAAEEADSDDDASSDGEWEAV